MTDIKNSSEEDIDQIMWENYQRKSTAICEKEEFLKHLQVFFDLTLDAYVWGEGDDTRDQAFAKWVKYLKQFGYKRVEAGNIFEAVDEFSAYS